MRGIILTASERVKGERSISSLYHLLTGSKNIQTLQDAHLFGNQDFYSIYKGLEKSTFDASIQVLMEEGLLTEKADDKNRRTVVVTEKAKVWLAEKKQKIPLHYFKGFDYSEEAEQFYSRLILFVQTLSNIKEKNFSFIPVIHNRDAEQFVRVLYQKIHGKEEQYVHKLYEELVHFLHGFSDTEASIFVERFSGYQHYGKSLNQLGAEYGFSAQDVRLLLTGMVHRLIESIKKDTGSYPVLRILFTGTKRHISLTGSARKTYDLYRQGLSPEAIAGTRRLKLNTIYDHLAEIALNDPQFPFTSFISEREAEEILKAIDKAGTYKLKSIKEQVSEDISFFQIRLILVFRHRLKRNEKEGEAVE